jgi:hypothetical protein
LLLTLLLLPLQLLLPLLLLLPLQLLKSITLKSTKLKRQPLLLKLHQLPSNIGTM